MTDDRKVLPFPVPPAADPDLVLGVDLAGLTDDILDAARLGALDAEAARLVRKARPPRLRPAPPSKPK